MTAVARVLVLEHDSAAATELSGGLAALGCEVTVLDDGQTGLVRAVTERFDVILVSANLPGTSGFRVCNRIKKDPTARTTPLFVMGASADQVEAHRALPTPADSYFAKPVVLADLVQRVRDIIEGPMPERADSIDSGVHLVDDLRRRVAEQERTIADLRYRGASGRSAALARANASMPSRAPAAPAPENEDELRELRERVARADRDVSALRSELDEARKSTSALRGQVDGAESGARETTRALEEREIASAHLERQLATARADNEQAARRIEELAKRLEAQRLALAASDEAAQKGRRTQIEMRAAHLLELNEARDVWERTRAGLERRVAEEVRTRDVAHASATARLRADLEATIAGLQQESLERERTHERVLAERITAAQDAARDELRTMLARVEEEATYATTSLANRIETEKAAAAEHRRAAGAATAEVLSLARGRVELETRFAELDALGAAAETRLSKQITELRDALSEAQSNIALEREVRASVERSLAQTRGELAAALEAMSIGAEETSRVTKERDLAQSDEQRAHAAEIERLKRELEAAESAGRAEAERAALAGETRLADVLAEASQKARAELDSIAKKLEDEHRVATDELEHVHASALASAREEHQTLRERVATDYAARLQSTEERWTQQLDDVARKAAAATAIEREARARADARVAELTEANAGANAATARLGAELGAARREVEIAQAAIVHARGPELETAVARAEAALRATHERTLADARDDRARADAERDRREAALRTEHEVELARVREELQRAHSTTEASALRRDEAEIVIARRDAEIEELRAGVAQREERLAERAAAAALERAEHARALDALARGREDTVAGAEHARAEAAAQSARLLAARDAEHFEAMARTRAELSAVEETARSAAREHTAHLAALDAKHARAETALTRGHQEALRELKAQMTEEAAERALEVEAAHEATIARLRETTAADLASALAETNATHTSELRERDMMLADARAAHATVITNLRGEAVRAIEQLRAELEATHESTLSAQKAAAEEKTRELLEEHALEMERLEGLRAREHAVSEKALAEATTLRDELHAARRARSVDQASGARAILHLEQRGSEDRAARDAQINHLEEETRRLSAQMRDERAALLDARVRERTKIEARHQDEILRRDQDLERRIAELESTHAGSLEAKEAELALARSAAEHALEDARRESNDERAGALTRQRAELEASHARELATIGELHHEELESIRDAWANAEAAMRAEEEQADKQLIGELGARDYLRWLERREHAAELDQVRLEASEALEKEQAAGTARVAKVRSTVDELNITIATAEEHAEEHRSEIARAQSELDARDAEIERLENELESLRSSAATAIAREEAARNALAAQDGVVGSARTTFETELAEARANAARAREEAVAAGDARVSELERRHSSALAAEEAARTAAEERALQAEQTLDAERTASRAAIANQQRLTDEQLTTLSAAHGEALAARDATHARELAEMRSATEARIALVERERDQTLESNAHGLEATNALAASRSLAAQREHDAQLAARDAAHLKEIASLLASANERVARIEREHDELLAARDQARADARASHAKELAEIRESAAARVRELEGALADRDTALADERARHAAAVVDLGRASDEARLEAVEALRLASDARYEDAVRLHEVALEEATRARGQQAEAHAQALAAAESATDLARSEAERHVAELSRAHAAAMAEHSERAEHDAARALKLARAEVEEANADARGRAATAAEAHAAEIARREKALAEDRTAHARAIEELRSAAQATTAEATRLRAAQTEAHTSAIAELQRRLDEQVAREHQEREALAKTHAEEIAARDAALADDRALRSRLLEEAREKAETRHGAAIAAEKAALREAVAEVEGRAAETKRLAEATLKQREAEIADLEAKLRAADEAQLATVAEMERRLVAAERADEARIHAQHSDEMRTLRTELDGKRVAAEMRARKAQARAREVEEQLASAERSHEESTARVRAELDEARAAARQSSDALRAAHEASARSAASADDMRQQVERLRANAGRYEVALREARAEAEKLRSTEEEPSDDTTQLVYRARAPVPPPPRAARAAQPDPTPALRAEIERWREAYDETVERHATEIAAIRAEVAREIAHAVEEAQTRREEELDDTISRVRNEIIVERSAAQRNDEAARAALATRLSALSEELATARDEIPQLEREITVLRSELMGARRELAQELARTSTLTAQVRRARQLLGDRGGEL